MPEEINYNHHMSYEQHLENAYQTIQEQLESDYKTYCNHCDDKPLSYENWLHCEINQVSKGNDIQEDYCDEQYHITRKDEDDWTNDSGYSDVFDKGGSWENEPQPEDDLPF